MTQLPSPLGEAGGGGSSHVPRLPRGLGGRGEKSACEGPDKAVRCLWLSHRPSSRVCVLGSGCVRPSCECFTPRGDFAWLRD